MNLEAFALGFDAAQSCFIADSFTLLHKSPSGNVRHGVEGDRV